MIKKLLLITVIALAFVLLASCDYLDINLDLPFMDNGAQEPQKHVHEYGVLEWDSAGHFNKCQCGDVINFEPHVDSEYGICGVCAYLLRDVLTVTVEAEENVNLTANTYSVKRYGTLTFKASVDSRYGVTVTGAEIVSEEIYGDLVIYSLSVNSVEYDITVSVVTFKLPCSHEWAEATCTAPATCILCGETDGVARGHDMLEATCTSPSRCRYCDRTEGDALPHTMSLPTCTAPAKCSYCEYTEGEALGHEMSEPTCTNAATCSVCGYTEGEALGHSLGEATCTAVASCTVCGYTEGEVLPHTLIPASCTTVASCRYCDYTEGVALGHSMSDATCTAPATCARCGLTEGDTEPHIYQIVRTVEPTCTEEGYYQYTCTCNASYISTIKATGHEGGNPTYTTEGICEKCNERYLPMLKLTYSAYGAVGDGVTDDFLAIKATHAYANANGLTVYADEGKTYNLGQHNDVITIMTDTVWEGATFIFDDRTLAASTAIRGRSIFNLAPDNSSYSVRINGGLTAGQTNIGVTFKTPVLLYIANSNVKQYIRHGANANSGADQQELILVDENGNVDPSTPIMWDYDVVTSAIAYPAGDKPITLSGGTFITRANAAPREYTYYARNITVRRSNVTLKGITHLITDEGDTGAPYNGFFAISYCNNILVEDCIFTGHKVYKLSSDANNSMGTYDISINSANDITFKNCTQTNSITDTKYWGIMGSNYCKNLTYDGCIFSRFDAHQGTYNATIINSEIGHQKLSVIGKGTLYIENTVFHSDTVVALRTDYGSTWEGEIIFKNITVNNTGTPILVNAGWNNHYFGYTCYLPTKIVVDGITLANKDYFYVLPNLPSHVDDPTVNGAENKNPLELTETIVIASNPNGYKYYVSVNTELFSGVQVVVI